MCRARRCRGHASSRCGKRSTTCGSLLAIGIGTAEYAERLNRLEQRLVGSGGDQYLPADYVTEFRQLRREALLANPLLDFPELLVVKRKPIPAPASVDERPGNDGKPLWASRSAGAEIGMPSNHECNSSLSRLGYENELAAFAPSAPNCHCA